MTRKVILYLIITISLGIFAVMNGIIVGNPVLTVIAIVVGGTWYARRFIMRKNKKSLK